MIKNYYLHLLAIMMVSMLSVVITSCGDDDDDPIPPVTPEQLNPLIGTWEYVERENGDSYDGIKWKNVFTYTYTFKNDGKYEYVWDYKHYSDGHKDWSESSHEKGNYAYDSTTRTLSIVPETKNSLSATVLTLSENVLTLMWNKGETMTFSKKN